MKRWFAPEVIQTSNLDCGPAALKCLLQGFRIPVPYGRLREACRTGLDGTCIDTIEIVATRFGLESEQITIPVDHVAVPQARSLPAIAIVQLPGGLTHFVVLWSRLGNYVQVMDPATGRRWVHERSLARELYRHTAAVPAECWREWAGSEDFLSVLRVRIRALNIGSGELESLVGTALADASHCGLSAVDAATRFITSLSESGAVKRPADRARLLQHFCRTPGLIPDQYWTVRPTTPDIEGREQVLVCGAILVRPLGSPADARIQTTKVEPEPVESIKLSPMRLAFRELGATGLTGIAAALVGIAVASCLFVCEAVLFRSFFEIFLRLQLPMQRIAALVAFGSCCAAGLAVEWSVCTSVLRLGRLLETRLRLAFLRKLPRLSDPYLQSRLVSDMADRSHALYRLKQLPNAIAQFLAPLFKLVLTAAGLIWLLPHSWPLIVLCVVSTLLPSFAATPAVRERDLKTRTHAGALMRFYLDAMLGLMPIRAQKAGSTLAAEQERLLGEWACSALSVQRVALVAEAVQTISVLGLLAAVLLTTSFESAAAGRLLLVVYWALNIPLLGREIGVQIRRYPYYRNLLARLLEPLAEPEPRIAGSACPLVKAPAIQFDNVSVSAAGSLILDSVNLDISAGAHVAFVGPSGAGKSSLAALLLGWLTPSHGTVTVDGEPLNVDQLRASLAWVDPAVQVWNDSLLSNIAYGSEAGSHSVPSALDRAMLRSVLENLPFGLQTKLGEGGALVSGGEAQRVRFARASLRAGAPLVILDEPFRGLDRDKRRELLVRARQLWRNSTLLCITHDIQETRDFDQVVVVEHGRISERGNPDQLLRDADSAYSRLLAAERHIHLALWSARFWRRIRIEDGRAFETLGETQTSIQSGVEVA